ATAALPAHFRSPAMVLSVIVLLPWFPLNCRSPPTVFPPQTPPTFHPAADPLPPIWTSPPTDVPHSRLVPDACGSDAPEAPLASSFPSTDEERTRTPVVGLTIRSPLTETSERSHHEPAGTRTSPSIAVALIASFEHSTAPPDGTVTVVCSGRRESASAS